MFVRTGATNDGSWLIFGRESSKEPATRTNGQTTTLKNRKTAPESSRKTPGSISRSLAVFLTVLSRRKIVLPASKLSTGAQKVISHKSWSKILSVCFESRWLRLRNVSTARIYQIVTAGHLRVQVTVGIFRLQSFVLIFPWVATFSSTVCSGFTALGQDKQHHRYHRVFFDAV